VCTFIEKWFKLTAELLCYAAVEGTPEMMYLLWRNYPSGLKKTKDTFILHTAVACNVVENVSVLVASDLTGLDVNELPSKNFDKSSRGEAARQTALHLAAWDDKIEIVNLLLKGGARIDILDSEGRTAPEKARLNNQFEVEKLMLAICTKGKDVKPRGKMSGIWK